MRINRQVWAGLVAVLPSAAWAADRAAGGPLPVTEAFWWFGVWVLGCAAVAKGSVLIWDWVLSPLARRRKTRLHVMMVQATRGAAQWAMLFAGINFSLRVCFRDLPQITTHAGWSVAQGAVYVALVFAATRLVYLSAHAFADWYGDEVAGKTATTLDDHFVALFKKVARFVFFFIAVTIVFGHFGIQITGLLATAGVASLAVAFAAQETISNMISGFILLIDQPFKPGDRIQLSDGKMGDVLDVGLRSTRILSFDHTVINIPNAQIAKSEVTNISAPSACFTVRASLGVAYGCDVRRAKAVLLGILDANPAVLKDPPPGVFFSDFDDSSLRLTYAYSVADYRDSLRVRDEVNLAIKDRFEAEGLHIPYPQREIRIVEGAGSRRGA